MFFRWSMKSFEPVGEQAQPHLSPEKDPEQKACAADAVEQSNLFNIAEKGKQKIRRFWGVRFRAGPQAVGAFQLRSRPGFSATKVMSSFCFLLPKDNGGIPILWFRGFGE